MITKIIIIIITINGRLLVYISFWQERILAVFLIMRHIVNFEYNVIITEAHT